MNTKVFLSSEDQEQILYAILTSTHFYEVDFYNALKDGCLMTTKIVYLASFRGDSWLRCCFFACNFTKNAALLFENIYARNDEFLTRCLDGEFLNQHPKVAPNFLMAFYVAPEKTLNHLKNTAQIGEIFSLVNYLNGNGANKDVDVIHDWLRKNQCDITTV